MQSYLHELTEIFEEHFPPVKISEIKRNALLVPFRINKCLSIINYESRRYKPESETVRTIYSNSWGELYSVQGFEPLESMRFDLCDVKPKPPTLMFAPEGCYKERLYFDFLERMDMEFKEQK